MNLQRLLQEQQARQHAEQVRQQQLRQQQEQLRQQEALRQQQAAQLKSQQEALQRQQQQQKKLQEQQRQQQEAAAKQQQLQAQQASQLQQQRSQPGAIDSLLPSGLGGLSLGNSDATIANGTPAAAIIPQQGIDGAIGLPSSTGNFDATASYLGALDESFINRPTNADSERQQTYAPRNPYPTPSSYPTTPTQVFENPAVFEKLGVDALFFIFYYSQGTYQQFLAARELKKQSWRYHKKYMTWFQRHEEPKVTTDEYEQGTYVYFDYESGWCQRIKSDFRFEYAYLEDSLSVWMNSQDSGVKSSEYVL